jgi:hypothetical protein
MKLYCLLLPVGMVLAVAACKGTDDTADGTTSTARLAQLDRSSVGASCTTSDPCSNGSCVLYILGEGASEGHCTEQPDCGVLQCPQGTECSLTGSDPAQMCPEMSLGSPGCPGSHRPGINPGARVCWPSPPFRAG